MCPDEHLFRQLLRETVRQWQYPPLVPFHRIKFMREKCGDHCPIENLYHMRQPSLFSGCVTNPGSLIRLAVSRTVDGGTGSSGLLRRYLYTRFRSVDLLRLTLFRDRCIGKCISFKLVLKRRQTQHGQPFDMPVHS